MPLDPSRYTGRHASPRIPSWVQLIAYERREGGWDLFIFEPPGVCPPEWEADRVDPNHIRAGELASVDQLDAAVPMIHEQLGPGYEPIVVYREREPGQRAGANRRLQYLHKAGATGYSLRKGADGCFELWARRKDQELLRGL